MAADNQDEREEITVWVFISYAHPPKDSAAAQDRREQLKWIKGSLENWHVEALKDVNVRVLWDKNLSNTFDKELRSAAELCDVVILVIDEYLGQRIKAKPGEGKEWMLVNELIPIQRRWKQRKTNHPLEIQGVLGKEAEEGVFEVRSLVREEEEGDPIGGFDLLDQDDPSSRAEGSGTALNYLSEVVLSQTDEREYEVDYEPALRRSVLDLIARQAENKMQRQEEERSWLPGPILKEVRKERDPFRSMTSEAIISTLWVYGQKCKCRPVPLEELLEHSGLGWSWKYGNRSEPAGEEVVETLVHRNLVGLVDVEGQGESARYFLKEEKLKQLGVCRGDGGGDDDEPPPPLVEDAVRRYREHLERDLKPGEGKKRATWERLSEKIIPAVWELTKEGPDFVAKRADIVAQARIEQENRQYVTNVLANLVKVNILERPGPGKTTYRLSRYRGAGNGALAVPVVEDALGRYKEHLDLDLKPSEERKKANWTHLAQKIIPAVWELTKDSPKAYSTRREIAAQAGIDANQELTNVLSDLAGVGILRKPGLNKKSYRLAESPRGVPSGPRLDSDSSPPEVVDAIRRYKEHLNRDLKPGEKKKRNTWTNLAEKIIPTIWALTKDSPASYAKKEQIAAYVGIDISDSTVSQYVTNVLTDLTREGLLLRRGARRWTAYRLRESEE